MQLVGLLCMTAHVFGHGVLMAVILFVETCLVCIDAKN